MGRHVPAWLAKLGPALAGFGVLVAVLVLQLSDPGALERVRLQVFDAFQRASPRMESGQTGVAVVDVDEESIARLGQWPWPRTDLATLVTRLGEAGAKVVAFDMVFSEADRTSPEALAARYAAMGEDGGEGVAVGRALGEELAALPGHDVLFARSFARVPVVTASFLDHAAIGREYEPRVGFSISGPPPTGHVAQYDGALLPLPELEDAAAGNGFVSLEADPDGVVRRVPLVAFHLGTAIPSLALEAVRVASGAGSPNLLTSAGSGRSTFADAAAVAVRMGALTIPVNDAGEMWVHFPRPGMLDAIPAWEVVTGALDRDALAAQVGGRIVFVGGSAAGLQDLVSTPMSERIAGVTVHAAAAEQMLAGDFLERPEWVFGIELLLVVLLGGGLALVLPRLGAAWGAVVAVVAVAGVAAGSWLAFANMHYLLDPTYPVIALASVYAVQTLAKFWREEKQRSYIHAAFDRYLSPELVRQIAADPDKLELGGQERDMSVLMCDIRGFSHISEQYSPSEVIDFLIEFLTPMSEILLESRATLDKYIGDAILAFWNAPLDDPEHHSHAARAALAMIAKTKELNQTMPAQEGKVWPGQVKVGVGLNSGLCCVGNMGSRQRLSYSLIGDTVNVASRLEGLTKQYGVPIIAGPALAEALETGGGRFALIELDRVRVVGRDHAETIFALLGDEGLASSEDFAALAQAHQAMLVAYRAQYWGAAEAALAQGQAHYRKLGIPGLHALFEGRIAALRADPPRADWDGTFQATSK